MRHKLQTIREIDNRAKIYFAFTCNRCGVFGGLGRNISDRPVGDGDIRNEPWMRKEDRDYCPRCTAAIANEQKRAATTPITESDLYDILAEALQLYDIHGPDGVAGKWLDRARVAIAERGRARHEQA